MQGLCELVTVSGERECQNVTESSRFWEDGMPAGTRVRNRKSGNLPVLGAGIRFQATSNWLCRLHVQVNLYMGRVVHALNMLPLLLQQKFC